MWQSQGGAWNMDVAEPGRHVNAPFTCTEEEESSSLVPSFLPRPNPVPHVWFGYWGAKKKEIFTRAPGFHPKSLPFSILTKWLGSSSVLGITDLGRSEVSISFVLTTSLKPFFLLSCWTSFGDLAIWLEYPLYSILVGVIY